MWRHYQRFGMCLNSLERPDLFEHPPHRQRPPYPPHPHPYLRHQWQLSHRYPPYHHRCHRHPRNPRLLLHRSRRTKRSIT